MNAKISAEFLNINLAPRIFEFFESKAGFLHLPDLLGPSSLRATDLGKP
jgi:hypothetical protein